MSIAVDDAVGRRVGIAVGITVGLAVVPWLAVVCRGGLPWLAVDMAVEITVDITVEIAVETDCHGKCHGPPRRSAAYGGSPWKPMACPW